MPVPRISAKEASDQLAKGEADLYLDVRSTPEFVQGHPAGAYHVPLLEVDPMRGTMQPNPDFMRVVRAAIPRDRRVLVGCQSGVRSQQAASLMAQEGYGSVLDVAGGFGGGKDAFGRKVSPSWAEQGLPVESGDGGERGYAVLRSKA
jgi:rhodanese-related sulfurtransferase